jgi:hypothetical protein
VDDELAGPCMKLRPALDRFGTANQLGREKRA